MTTANNDIDTISAFIAENPLFESLSRPVIRSIAEKLQEQVVPPNRTIMTEGDVGDCFYIIYDGHVRAVRDRLGKEYVLSEMGLGEGFGEMALLTDQPRSCTIKTVDEVRLLVLRRDDFEILYSRYPELTIKFEELRSQRVSLLEDSTLNASMVTKFIASRNSQGVLDYSMLDLLSKLNVAAGGEEQLEHCKETGQLAREMSKILCPMVSDDLLFAGYLHEIGKISLPHSLVVKERQGYQLTDDEKKRFERIYAKSADILAPNKLLHQRLNFIADLDALDYHDMRLEAQILKVANDFLELRSVYYRNLPVEAVLQRMEAMSGTLYNPRVITALCKNCNQFRDLRVEAQLNVVRMIVRALDSKDHYTYRHSVDVRNITLILCERLNLSRQEQRLAETAAELHDAGKIYIDESILNAPRRLTEEEFAIMKTHAQRSADFFTDVYGMDELEQIVGAHHEKYNGQGYPRGLQGEEIPLLSRILAIADVWSALTTPRVYRLGEDGKPQGMPIPKAFGIMQNMAEEGHFDPNIFQEFCAYIKEYLLCAGNSQKSRELPDEA